MIIDAHTHWGSSVTLGMTVTTAELQRQAALGGVDRIVIFPFPSQALADENINAAILAEAARVAAFIPYYYIPEDLRAIPRDAGFCGGKWHWVRGVQDWASNYDVLEDPALARFIETSASLGLPLVFEEELAFTEAFVRKAPGVRLIIPHLGLLGGDPLDFLKSFRHSGNVCFDTALAGRDMIARFVDTIGPERVIFGSDVPFGTMAGELAKVLDLAISDDRKELILHGNIERLAGLEASP